MFGIGCNGVPYAPVTSDELGALAAERFDVVASPSGAPLLKGSCPRCGAPMSVLMTGSTYRRASDTAAAVPSTTATHAEPMMCKCSGDHPDRPEGRKGCGAFWVLDLKIIK
jgi:hypothetical protein